MDYFLSFSHGGSGVMGFGNMEISKDPRTSMSEVNNLVQHLAQRGVANAVIFTCQPFDKTPALEGKDCKYYISFSSGSGGVGFGYAEVSLGVPLGNMKLVNEITAFIERQGYPKTTILSWQRMED